MTGAGLHLTELDAHTMAADQRGFNIIWHNQPLSLNSGGPPPLMSLECFNPILSAYIFYTHNFGYLKTGLGQGKVGPHMTPARVSQPWEFFGIVEENLFFLKKKK